MMRVDGRYVRVRCNVVWLVVVMVVMITTTMVIRMGRWLLYLLLLLFFAVFFGGSLFFYKNSNMRNWLVKLILKKIGFAHPTRCYDSCYSSSK